MENSPVTAARSQRTISTMLLTAMALTCVAVGMAAHLTPVIDNHVHREVSQQRAVNGMSLFNGGYLDDGDYVLVDQLPDADYSRGGVYFIGASETKISIRPWELPAEEQALIHNYSLGDLRHSDVLHFVRSLVEEDGLLEAGPEKTTIVLGLSYQMTRTRDLSVAQDRYVPMLFERNGMYLYDPVEGIQRKPMTALERFLRIERIRAGRLLQLLISPPEKVKTGRDDPATLHQYLINQMGSDWRPEMEKQVAYVGETIDYLQSLGVRVRVIFPPEGSWHDGLPYHQAYRALLAPIFKARGVPVSDLRDLLPDSDFGDAVHARFSGELKLHKVYRDIALQALSDMGAMPRLSE
jgi:hypothetical protein